jgi:hypothetical protein
MDILQRIGRALLLGLIVYIAARALEAPPGVQWTLTALVVLASLVNLLLKWAGVAVGAVVLWALAHLVGLAPSATSFQQTAAAVGPPLQKMTTELTGSQAATPAGQASLSDRLADLKDAKDRGLLGDAEYRAARARVLEEASAGASPSPK